jgi:uncharacterized MAPEG superfamily protein
MNIAFICILIMGLMPFIFVAIAKFGSKQFGATANHNPREFIAKLEGWPKRAAWAQINSFEAFPLFAIAVLIAIYKHAPQATIDKTCLIIVGLRIIYGILYIADKASLRSLVWFISLCYTIYLFFI